MMMMMMMMMIIIIIIIIIITLGSIWSRGISKIRSITKRKKLAGMTCHPINKEVCRKRYKVAMWFMERCLLGWIDGKFAAKNIIFNR